MSQRFFFDIVGYALLAFVVTQLAMFIRAFGWICWRPIWIMAWTSLKGRKVILLLSGCFLLMRGLFPSVLSDWVPPFPRLFECGVGLVLIANTCLPPAILFLAASKEPGLALLHAVQRSASPLKLVHLLDYTQKLSLDSDGQTRYRAKELAISEFRVRYNWEKTVMDLSLVVPVIIVDARILSPAVLMELDHIVASSLEDRTFVVAHHPLTKFYAPEFLRKIGHLRFTTSAALEKAVPTLGWSFLFSSRSLVRLLKRRIYLRPGRTIEELAAERSYEQTLRKAGMIEDVIKWEMHDYRWRRDRDSSPPPWLGPNDDEG